jgi:hypothetical protein
MYVTRTGLCMIIIYEQYFLSIGNNQERAYTIQKKGTKIKSI